MHADLPEVSAIQRLRLRPGDVVVATVARRLTGGQAQDVRNRIAAVIGDGVSILVLSDFIRLSVVAPEEVDP